MKLTLRMAAIAAMVLVVALTVAACGSSNDDTGGESATGTGAESLSLRVGYPFPPTCAMPDLLVADQLGFFDEENVDFEHQQTSENIPVPAILDTGQADLAGPGASEVLIAADKGAEYKLLFDPFTSGAEGIAVMEDSEIETLDQLEGGTIGISSNEDNILVATALDAVGLSTDDVKTIVVGTAGPTVANALEGGDVDAYVATVLDFAAVESAGLELRRIEPPEVGVSSPQSYIATPATVEEMPETIEAFLRAVAKGMHVGETNRDAVLAACQEGSPEEWRDRKFAEAVIDAGLEGREPTDPENLGAVDKKAWEGEVDKLLAVGDLENEVDIDALVDDRFIAAANDFDRAEVEAAAETYLEEHPIK